MVHKIRVTGTFNIFVIHQCFALEGPKGNKIFCELGSSRVSESGAACKDEDNVYFLSDH